MSNYRWMWSYQHSHSILHRCQTSSWQMGAPSRIQVQPHLCTKGGQSDHETLWHPKSHKKCMVWEKTCPTDHFLTFEYLMGKATKPSLFNSLKILARKTYNLPIWPSATSWWAGMRLSHSCRHPSPSPGRSPPLFALLHAPPTVRQQILSTEQLTRAS